MLKEVSKLFSQKIKVWILILLGALTWSFTMVKSGWIYSYGMGFWGPNGHDGIWHIALINSLTRGSFEMPTFAGQSLKNYHIGFDLLVALLHRLTTIPVVNLYFQIIPPLLALFVGVLTYKFVLLWKDSKKEAFWATFLVYFGGSFGWIITLLRHQGLGGESMFWSQQAISTLINPPFALSLVFLLLGFISLLRNKTVFSILFFGILIQIKSYAGILALTGLAVVGVYQLLFKKEIKVLKVSAGAFIISVFLFLPYLKTSKDLLIFQPFWYLETLISAGDRFFWPKLAEAMLSYKNQQVLRKFIPAYSFAFLLFIFGNFGTRIISLVNIGKKIDEIKLFIIFIILGGVAIPMLFLQKGTPWNTIQFFYYSLFFSGILAGVALGEFMENSRLDTTLLYSIEVGIILLTIPTTIGTLRYVYLPSRPPAKISKEELEALNFLSKEPKGIVLTYPFDREAAKEAENNPPRPLYLYDSTAYVSAFSQKPVYLEDEVNLEITGYNWRLRRENETSFYNSQDINKAKLFLKNENISYVYLEKGQELSVSGDSLGLSKVFHNESVDVFKVD